MAGKKHEEEDDISSVEVSDEEMEEGDEEFYDPGPSDPDVVTKYKLASEIANRVIKKVAAASVAGAKTLDLCKLGDELINAETKPVFVKAKRGVSFPTCVSVNNVVCHHSPFEAEGSTTLANGDVVKIDLGAHIDGYIGVVATTVIVGATKEKPITGPKADAIMACHYAMEAALRILRPGANTGDVSKAVQQIAADFGCTPVENMLSHQLSRNVIDGEKAVLFNPTDQLKKDHKDHQIEQDEVYSLDIIISTGDGKAKLFDGKPTILKKTDASYQLKMRNSRAFLTEVSKKFGSLPFSIRACEDEKKAKIGMLECVKHGVLQPYDMLLEKEGNFVVQCKMQVILTASGTMRVTDAPLPVSLVKSDHKVKDKALFQLINSSLSGKKKKATKEAAPAAAAAAAPAPAATTAAPAAK